MAIKALMVDFYGTLVREEDGVIKDVCRELADSSPQILSLADTARALWQACHDRYLNWYGGQYRPVAELEADALREGAEQFQCRADVADLTGQLAAANRAPEAYADGRLFCASLPLPVCLLSNGDRPIMEKIVTYTQLNLPEMVFSGDVRSCKPRREIFEEAVPAGGQGRRGALHWRLPDLRRGPGRGAGHQHRVGQSGTAALGRRHPARHGGLRPGGNPPLDPIIPEIPMRGERDVL